VKGKGHRRHKRRDFKIQRRVAPGSSPGTVVSDPNSAPTHVRVIAYGPQMYEERADVRVRDLPLILDHHEVTWINVEGLGDTQLIEELGEQFHLHRLALEDVVNLHQRAKVEEYGEVLFVVLRMVTFDQRACTEQLSLFIGPNWVVSIQEGSPGDPFDGVRRRLREGVGKIRLSGSDYLAYALIDAVIDSFYPVLEQYAERLDALEEACVHGRDHGVIDHLHQAKADLLLIRRAIWPQREAIGKLLLDSTPRITDNTRTYLRDCYDHVVQVVELVETYRELVADLRDLYMSTISNRINETMRVLTIISTLFIPLTFIAGIYGMNFDVNASPYNMPELRWRYGYLGCLGLMSASTIGMLVFFIRKGWIGRRFWQRIWERADDDHVA
jgi:magnesium transporter